MKIIFLDIDGVLNIMSRKSDEYGSHFHSQFVDNLKRLIDETGAKIVISSTWRMSGFEIMKEMWEKRGLPGEVIGITGYGGGSIQTRMEDDKEVLSIPRGSEIKHWLGRRDITTDEIKFAVWPWSIEAMKEQFEKQLVKGYVIIDDDSDFLLDQYRHFVKTSDRWNEEDAIQGLGLTSKATDEAIKILNTPLDELYEDKF